MIKEFFKELNIKAGLLHFVCNDRMVAFCHASIPQAFRTSYKKVAFTLAEVLITLGIIGVVAAMTIPAIHGAILKHRVETSLKKFNSTMNNALRLYVAENGDLDFENIVVTTDSTYEKSLEILNQYFLPYIKRYSKIEKCTNSPNIGVCVYFQDGTHFKFTFDGNGGDFFYYITEKESYGKTTFLFQIAKYSSLSRDKKNSIDRIEPYIFDWDGTENGSRGLRTHSRYGCNRNAAKAMYCTKLIQLNNWKIPKDYPFKF